MEQTSKLTFKALNERIDETPQHPGVIIELSTREKYGSATVLLAVALFYLSIKVLPHDEVYTVVIACSLLLIELAATAAILIPAWPPRIPSLPSIRSERTDYAEQLDFDFGHYKAMIAWILQFPRDQIADMADYAEMRQDRFREKQPLLVGGVEKLGALPIIVAIAAQFRSMQWPPDISWREIVTYLVIAFFYWLCLINIGTRHRGRFLELVLKRALVLKDRQAAETTTSDQVTPTAASTKESAGVATVS